MSSAGSPSLELERRIGPEECVALAAIAAAGLVPWLLPLSLGLRATFFAIAVSVAAFASWWSGLIGLRHRVSKARWESDGTWWLFDTGGVRWQARLDAGSRSFRGLIWLRWRSEKGARQMLLWRRVLPVQTARRLAVRLRLEADMHELPTRAIERENAPGGHGADHGNA